MYIGSGRSLPGFNIYEYLKNCEELFSAFGGHAMAVGLSIPADNLEILEKYIENHPVTVEETNEVVLALDKNKIDLDALNELNSLKPFGSNFKEPLFMIEGVDCNSRYIIAGKYPKYTINGFCDAISFKTGDINRSFDAIIGKLKKDDYHRNKVSLLIEDLI